MKRNLFIVLFLIAILIEVVSCILLTINHLYAYVLFLAILLCITVSMLIKYYKSTLSTEDAYLSYLKNIKKTFSSVLISISEIPDLKKKNIIKVKDLEEIFDVGMELKKPILYYEKEDCCIFILVLESDLYLYILSKSNDSKEKDELFKKYIPQKESRKTNSKSKTKNEEKEKTTKKPKSTDKVKSTSKASSTKKAKSTSKTKTTKNTKSTETTKKITKTKKK